MEMKVDSNLIKSVRESRGWSQEHLASVAGLSLRTIQRIERTGAASFESATALAAVLALDLAGLRVPEAASARVRALRLSLELPLRLALALVSGSLCGLHYLWRYYYDAGNSFNVGFEWFDYLVAGALFALAVLCPYLKPGRGVMRRALGLIASSALSYFCAEATVLLSQEWFPIAPDFCAFVFGSVVGLVIVVAAAKFLLPLRLAPAIGFLGVMASVVGGTAMYASFEYFGDTSSGTVFGYCVWHVMASLALRYGQQPDDAQRGWLAEFAHTRSRFSIVPGWLRLGRPAWA